MFWLRDKSGKAVFAAAVGSAADEKGETTVGFLLYTQEGWRWMPGSEVQPPPEPEWAMTAKRIRPCECRAEPINVSKLGTGVRKLFCPDCKVEWTEAAQ